MKRKNWVRLLSVVAALMLPLTAMAQSAPMDMLSQARADGKEIVTTVTFVPGGMISGDQMVTDLSSVAALCFSGMKDGLGAFAVVLSGVDVLSAQVRVQPDGLYVQSETLGSQPLYFSWEDVNKGIISAMQSSGADQATIDQYSQSVASVMEQISAINWDEETLANDTKPATEEEVKQQIIQTMGGDESLVNWINGIEAKAVETKGEFTVDGSDKADTKTTYTLDKNDFAEYYNGEYYVTQIATQLKASDASMTDEQARQAAKDQIAEIQKELIEADTQMVVTVYTAADEFVAMEIGFSAMVDASDVQQTEATSDLTTVAAEETTSDQKTVMAEEATSDPTTVTAEENKKVAITMAGQLTLKTDGDQKAYQGMMTVSQDSKAVLYIDGNVTYDKEKAVAELDVLDEQSSPVMTLDFTGNYADETHKTAVLEGTVYSEGTSYACMLNADKVVGDQTIDLSLTAAFATNLEDIKATPDAYTVGTLKVNIAVQDDSGLFNTLKEATPATSMDVMNLTEEQLQSYLTTLQVNAYDVLYKVYTNLPKSISDQFASMMTGN